MKCFTTLLQRHQRTQQRLPISTSSRRLKQVSNGTPNDVSVVGHKDVEGVHDVLLARLYNAFCKSQMKQPVVLLWYVSTTSLSYAVATPC